MWTSIVPERLLPKSKSSTLKSTGNTATLRSGFLLASFEKNTMQVKWGSSGLAQKAEQS